MMYFRTSIAALVGMPCELAAISSICAAPKTVSRCALAFTFKAIISGKRTAEAMLEQP